MTDAFADTMGRREFVKGAGALAAASLPGIGALGDDGAAFREAFQREIDGVTPREWGALNRDGSGTPGEEVRAMCARYPALARYEAAFERVLGEIDGADAASHPAVWLVYNMGLVVKTRETLFSVDLVHRRAEELAPRLDFALITHNHGDHYTRRFLEAMDWREKKTVVSNFWDNYGAHFAKRHPGGYTRAVKTFRFGDVEVRTTYTDHNDYLVDFTTVFEITVGDFTIYHSGDCSNAAKLMPLAKSPDLWVFHPLCYMKPVDGARAVRPKRAVVAHLNELGHAKGHARWTWADGERVRAELEAAGYDAVVPLWGERIC